jgi:YVTN family beta-propeller protein
MRTAPAALAIVGACLAVAPAHATPFEGLSQTPNGSLGWKVSAPGSLAVAADGTLTVADTGKHRILLGVGVAIGKGLPNPASYDSPGALGNGDGEFNAPSGVALGPDAQVYVADTGNNRVQALDAGGKFVRRWGHSGGDGTPGTGPGDFDAPMGIAVDRGGDVYVADTGNDRIERFTPEGVLITTWGSSGAGTGQLDGPRGLAVSGTRVYVADSGNNRIAVFDTAGTPVATITIGLSDPGDVDIARDGSIFVADTGNNRVAVFTHDGHYREQITRTTPHTDPDRPYTPVLTDDKPLAGPRGVAVDCRGGVWIADTGNDRFVRMGDPAYRPPPCLAPVATTNPAKAIDTDSATLSGTLSASGAPALVWFEYQATGAYTTSTTPFETFPVAADRGRATVRVTGLLTGMHYSYRIVVATAEGVTPGDWQGFEVLHPLSVVLNVEFHPARFAAAGGRQARGAPRATTGTGMLVTATDFYTDVRLTVFRLTTGRRLGRTCVALTPARRTRARCTRRTRVGATHFGIGRSRLLPFDGRIGGRALAPGRYEGAVQIEGPYFLGFSKPYRQPFRIVAGRR